MKPNPRVIRRTEALATIETLNETIDAVIDLADGADLEEAKLALDTITSLKFSRDSLKSEMELAESEAAE